MTLSKLIKPISFAICLFLVIPETAQAQFSLDAEFRPRTEYRNGYRLLRTADTDPAFFTSQRTRLNLSYQADRYEVFLSAQDVRVWGETAQLGDPSNVNIHEAWAELYLSDRFQLKLGRQELVYDDHRLLGSVNWTQQARSHDALLLKYRVPSSDLKIDLGAAYNQAGENLLGNTYPRRNYKVLSYLWANKQFGNLEASGLFLTDASERPTGQVVGDFEIHFRYTYGIHLAYRTGDWNIVGTGYLQRGDYSGITDLDAYMLAGKVSYGLNNLKLTAGYDYLSGGDADDLSPRSHTFNTLYATNHKFYGHMDYFLNIPVDTRAGGLQDLYLKSDVNLTESAGLNITYHHFLLAGRIADPLNPVQRLERDLASEIDLSFTYGFTDEITFKVGYSTLFSRSSLDRIQGREAEDMQHWGWAMLVLTPQFIAP